MNRKSLLMTLLLAVFVPMAAFAQSNHFVTVYNGKDTNVHLPLDGTHGVGTAARNQFIMDKSELGDIVGKPITKMAFHIAAPAPVMNSGNHLSYEVLLAEVDETSFTDNHLISSSAMTHAEYVTANVSLNIVDNMLEVNFSEAYIFSGEKNLLVQFSCLTGSQSYYSPWYSTSLRFYGVNVARAGNVDMGYGIYRHYGFVPKTTFTYQDEATWANTNRPQNLSSTVDSDGAHITLNWVAPSGYSGSYQTLCVEHGTTPNWSNAETTSYTTNLFYDLTPNTTYDLYVRAKSGVLVSANAKAIVNTANITDLDNGNLVIDFDGAFVPNGVVATGSSITLETSRYFYMEGNGYGSYLLPSSSLTINLPKLHYTNATNGVIMEFDLVNTENLQVKFNKQGITTDIASYSNVGYGSNMKHYSVRAVDGTGAQDAYFQLVGSFNIDNIIIYKAPTTMKPINVQAVNVTTNSAEITWDDDNTGNVTHYLRYRKTSETDWHLLNSTVTSPYILSNLDVYTQYEVQLMSYRNSNDNSDWTSSLVFATMAPATATPYSEYFTNLSHMPSYWRVATGEGVEYSLNSDMLRVHNTLYEFTSYGATYTAYTTLDAYVILPYFENLASLQLSFKAGRTAGSYNELMVGVMSDPFDATTFRTLDTRILNGPSTTYNFGLADAAWTNGHIAIKLNHYESNSQSVWFDDFVVTRYAAPTDLTVSNVTNTSVTLGWTTTAPAVEIQYRTTGGSWSESITPEGNSHTITGLTASTAYEARIRANYGSQNSDWVSFGTFRTLMQAAVVVDANHSYSEDFQFININPGWMYLNGSSSSSCCAWTYGNPNVIGESGRFMYITDDDGATNHYTVGNSSNFGNIPFQECTVFASKTFSLSAGIYTFSYDHRVKGVSQSDYARVALVPADTPLEAVYGGSIAGLSYNTLPTGWIALDGGTELPQYGSSETWTTKTVTYDLFTPGEYMLVFIWHQDAGGTHHSAVQKPVAIDNITISCTTLIYGPDFNCAGTTDTEATLNLYTPGLGIAPMSYEVQYEPALDYNNYVDAPIVTVNVVENPQTVTLTGLTPKTLYNVRLRSVYTTNGHSIYSDWVDAASCFETKYSRPTDLTVVDQTTSWANVVWAPVAVNLAEGEYINYWWQLTTDPNDWGEYIGQGQVSNSWAQNFVPGTYYFRVSTAVYQENGNLFMGQSDWSEPVAFTIAPWTDPVTIFPLINSFEEWSYRFADGLTLDGTYVHLDITSYSASGLPTPEGGANEYKLQFHSCDNKTAYLVLPPLRPSTSDALVSFWWYHDSSINETNDGVIVEFSDNGSSWSSFGNMITRYAAESGWVKYQQVVPAAGTNPIYIRLHFVGSNSNQWTRCCYLDDLTVNNFKSYQPYISYVGCDASTADITLYDYGYENGWPSSAFQVQYREYRNPGEPEEEWITYSEIANEAPYTFINHLMVTGLQPATLYEFRACARASYGGFDFPWSNYCEPYRQWTSCGTYLISPSYSYTEDFEELFNGNDCWTGDMSSTGWRFVEDGHLGGSCLFIDASGDNYQYARTIKSPMLSFSNSCDNVILRFWTKCTYEGTSTNNYYVKVFYKSGTENKNYNLYMVPETNDWQLVELSLSKNALGSSVSDFQIAFYHNYGRCKWYIDDIEIVANAYDKVFDYGQIGVSGIWTNAANWFPHEVPNSDEDVMIMSNVSITAQEVNIGSIQFGSYGNIELKYNQALSTNNGVGELNALSVNLNPAWQTKAYIDVKSGAELNVNDLAARKANSVRVSGTANITTLTPGEANSVVVKDGGVLNANTITSTILPDNTTSLIIEDGGQVKCTSDFVATIKKNIVGYNNQKVNDNGGYCLFATPLVGSANNIVVPKVGESYLFEEVDLYWFDGTAPDGLEWINAKAGESYIYGLVTLAPTHGYLYARANDGEVSVSANNVDKFSRTDQDIVVENLNSSDVTPFGRFNLIGNPYTCNAYLKQGGSYIPFYKMNDTGDAIVGVAAGTPIKPCEGVFVCCTEPSTVTFTTTEPTGLGQAPEDLTVLLPSHMLYEDQDAGTMVGINLVAGWNWFAPNIETSVGALQSLLGNDAMIQREEGNTNETVAPGQMVKIHVDEEGEFTLTGLPVAANITIGNGINWIGYTGASNLTISEALGSITPNNGDKIISQDQGFAIYNGTSWEGTLATLVPGKGYVYIR